MNIMYMDESGVPEPYAGTSHFVLLGFSIPARTWRNKDAMITEVKTKYGLERSEIHAAWLARRYVEQEHIPDLKEMSWDERRRAMEDKRKATLLHTAAVKSSKSLNQLKKNYRKTADYIHLTREERLDLLHELADCIRSWTDCRLFAEAVNKSMITGEPSSTSILEEAFSNVVSRFHTYLDNFSRYHGLDLMGLLVQDNNPTVERRLTELMRTFYIKPPLWLRKIHRIVETPLFVDSHLTSMVQLADLCSYATRRFFENNELDLFDKIYSRFDRAGPTLVGLRHYTGPEKCSCRVCLDHQT